jgi:hypothetical protein
VCSHGNATDLGEMLPLYEELSRLLRCNVLAYDYAGWVRRLAFWCLGWGRGGGGRGERGWEAAWALTVRLGAAAGGT